MPGLCATSSAETLTVDVSGGMACIQLPPSVDRAACAVQLVHCIPLGRRLTCLICPCSIVYDQHKKTESREWYNVRKRKDKDCKLLGDKDATLPPPAAVPTEHVANGYAKFRQHAQKTGEPAGLMSVQQGRQPCFTKQQRLLCVCLCS